MSDLSRRDFIAGLGMAASLPFLNVPAAAGAGAGPPAAAEHAQDRSPGRHRAQRRGVGALLHGRLQHHAARAAVSGRLPLLRPVRRSAGQPAGRLSRHRRLARPRHLHRPLLHVGLRLPPRQRRDHRRRSTDAVAKAGLGKLAGGGGIGGIFSDPDGIEIQFLPAPDTLVTAAVPSRSGAVAQGAGHAARRRSRAAARRRPGEGRAVLPDSLRHRKRSATRTPGRVWFQIGDTRLGLSRPRPARSRTSRTSGSRWRRSIAARSPRA